MIGQMGNPDMKVPIAYAFSWPERAAHDRGHEAAGSVRAAGGLTFQEPDHKVFRTIDIA